MRTSYSAIAASALAFGLFGISGTAHAGLSNVVFEYTYSPYDTGSEALILNGSTVVDATNTGWYDQNGDHTASNPDYAAGTCGSSDACAGTDTQYNDFFTFNLSGVSTPITSATLTLYNPSAPPAPGSGFLSIDPLTYSTFDVTTPIATLIQDNTGRTDIFADLGSGIAYGSAIVGAAADGTQVNISLNDAAVAAIASAEGGQFAIGGAVTSAVPTVPLPAALPMFGAAVLGLMAFSSRRRGGQGHRA